MPQSFRIERISEIIKELISELVVSGIKDPRVGFVTITAVRVSRDMSVAKVHYSVMGDESARAASHKGLVSARRFLRSEIARSLKVRTVPELKFVYDDSLDKSLRIEEKLRDVGLGGGIDPADPKTHEDQ